MLLQILSLKYQLLYIFISYIHTTN